MAASSGTKSPGSGGTAGSLRGSGTGGGPAGWRRGTATAARGGVCGRRQIGTAPVGRALQGVVQVAAQHGPPRGGRAAALPVEAHQRRVSSAAASPKTVDRVSVANRATIANCVTPAARTCQRAPSCTMSSAAAVGAPFADGVAVRAEVGRCSRGHGRRGHGCRHPRRRRRRHRGYRRPWGHGRRGGRQVGLRPGRRRRRAGPPTGQHRHPQRGDADRERDAGRPAAARRSRGRLAANARCRPGLRLPGPVREAGLDHGRAPSSRASTCPASGRAGCTAASSDSSARACASSLRDKAVAICSSGS